MSAAETRQLWLAIHRYIGLATLIFLFIAGLTGSILVLGKPLDAALNADLFRTAGQVQPFNAVKAFEDANPGIRVTSFPLTMQPGRSMLTIVESRDPAHPLPYSQAFLGPDGKPVGVRAVAPGLGRRHLVEAIFQFHYTLLAGDAGRWLMGLMALAWLISNLVGLYLTLPLKGPFWKNWKKTWTINLKARLAKLMLELHQASGLWLLILLTVLAFTSVSMNFFSEAFTPMVQAVSPARPSPFDGPGQRATGRSVGFHQALVSGVERAAVQNLTWTPAQLGYVADRDLYQVTFTTSGVVNYSGLGPISYYLRGSDGAFVYEDNPYTDSAGRKLSRALYPLHTGQVAGWPGELVAFILGAATVEQCITGSYLWLKRRGPRIAGKKALKARKAAEAAA